MKKPKRHVYEVRFVRKGSPKGLWYVFANGAYSDWWNDRAAALNAVRALSEVALERFDQLSELVVYRKNGTIGERRTYGKDPRRSKG